MAPPPFPPTASARADHIDGIRGWASLFVLLFHLFNEMLGRLFPVLNEHWLLAPLNGGFWVLVFFILSGDALTFAFFQGRADLNRMAVKRYPRLTVPILMSCALVFAVEKTGLDFRAQGSAVLLNQAWLAPFLQIDFTLPRLIKYALIDVYARHTAAESFNPLLWSMSIEIVGSFMVFLLCHAWGSLRRPAWVLACCAAALMALSSHYALFLVGMLLGLMRQRGWLRHPAWGHWPVQALALLTPLLALAAVHLRAQHPLPLSATAALASLSVLAFYVSPWFQRLFTTRLSRYLGDISFALYTTQFAVLISLSCHLAARQGPAMGAEGAATLVLTSLLVCVGVAHLFTRGDQWVMRHVDQALRRHVLR